MIFNTINVLSRHAERSREWDPSQVNALRSVSFYAGTDPILFWISKWVNIQHELRYCWTRGTYHQVDQSQVVIISVSVYMLKHSLQRCCTTLCFTDSSEGHKTYLVTFCLDFAVLWDSSSLKVFLCVWLTTFLSFSLPLLYFGRAAFWILIH